MVERNAGVAPDNRIAFRIGIHLGDIVEESDGDLMGDGVNIAARLEGLCEPGGVCLSGEAHGQVRDRLKEKFVDLGERQLKNIARPVRAYALPAAAIAGPNDQGPRATRVSALRGGGSARLSALAAALAVAIAAGASAGAPDSRRDCAALLPRRQARDRAAAFDRRPAVREPERRQGARIFRRRDHRRSDHRSLASARQLRHRPQHRLHLQRQAGRREADRARTWREVSARRQRASPR